jgi:hypothetical protein
MVQSEPLTTPLTSTTVSTLLFTELLHLIHIIKFFHKSEKKFYSLFFTFLATYQILIILPNFLVIIVRSSSYDKKDTKTAAFNLLAQNFLLPSIAYSLERC